MTCRMIKETYLIITLNIALNITVNPALTTLHI